MIMLNMLYFTDILPHEILFIFYVFHSMIYINIYDFASNEEDYQGHYQLNKRENDEVAK